MAGYRSKKSSGPKQPPLTHFLCVPLVNPESKPQLEKALQEFRDLVSSKHNAAADELESSDEARMSRILPSVHPKAIRPVGALHCTLGVMSLDQEKLQRATDFLHGLDVERLMTADKASQHRVEAFKIDLKGLVSMHPPSKTSILYCAPTDSDGQDRLYPFCLAVQKAFNEQRLVIGDDRKLKLHATILNTIYAKGRNKTDAELQKQEAGKASRIATDVDVSGVDIESVRSGQSERQGGEGDEQGSRGHGPNASAPLKIDATAILEKFSDFVWAEQVTLDRIAICEMGAKKILNDNGEVVAEEYKEVASLKLPT